MAQRPSEPADRSGSNSERPRRPRTPTEFTLLATVAACRHLNLEAVARFLGVPERHAYLLLVSDTGRAFVNWLERELPPEAFARFRPAADFEAEAMARITPTPTAAPSGTLPVELPKTTDEVLRELGYGQRSTKRKGD